MLPLVLAIAGAVALGAAAWIQRGFGPRARVGRLLAVVPKVSIADAVHLAQSGEARYVRVDGRIDSDQEFEDADQRPLVYRRTRLEWRAADGRGPWTEFDVKVEVVPFSVREGLDAIVVDGASLDTGLVVVPRERKGVGADLGDARPAQVPEDASVRMTIEQASSVEHAAVLGVPMRSAGAGLAIGPGLGRPLILSTLEDDEAMRVLTGGATRRARLALACLALGVGLLVVAAGWYLFDWLVASAPGVLAASPEPTLRPGTDTRTTGAGPGLVGEPLLALVGVAATALLSLLASLAYVRLTGGPRRAEARDERRPW